MKKMVAVLVFLAVMSICPVVRADTDIVSLYNEALKSVWEATASVRDQIQTLEMEIKAVLAASTFDQTTFLNDMSELQDLHDKIREAMDIAIANLASQLSVEERTKLAELIFHGPGPGPGGPPPGPKPQQKHQ